MAVRALRVLFVIVMAAALLYNPHPHFSCGPFFETPVFTYAKHPEIPLDKFAQGQLGILLPTYARSYLYVAYRYLTGLGLDREQRQAVLEVWGQRIGYSGIPAPESEDWPQRWLDARNAVPGLDPVAQLNTFRQVSPSAYNYYQNCGDDAFRTAIRTLHERMQKFGATSSEVRDWVQAQDQVFANCSGDPVIPAAAKPDAHALVRADRVYQIAAAHFYAGHFDAAHQLFTAIARDNASPWTTVAPYLVARNWVRQATLTAGEDQIDVDILAQAEAQLQQILRDKKLQALHPDAQKMLNRIRAKLHPTERLRELAKALLQKTPEKITKQDLWDYTVIIDRLIDEDRWWPTMEGKTLADFPRATGEDDLTDWLLTFQVADAAAREHALEKWEQTASLPWLVASLSKLDATHPKLTQVLDAAGKVKPDSSAFPTIAFHRLRLMIELGKKDEARQQLDSVLAQTNSTMPPSSQNLLRALRLKLARNLDEFLKYAQRMPVGVTFDYDGRELPEDPGTDVAARMTGRAFFDADSAWILNERMPLSVLQAGAHRHSLPDHLRRELARAAWVRAVLLEREEVGKELVLILEKLAPELKGALQPYLSASNPDARKFAAAFIMLKFPGLWPYVRAGGGRRTAINRIDNFRDNWWCSFGQEGPHDFWNENMKLWVSTPLRRLYPESKFDFPDFLDQAQRATALKEWDTLVAAGTAPNYLCQQVLHWARQNPTDPRVPEALHLAVKSTRYGCTDERTGRFSRAAYELLHRRYPGSEWARRTKYWYQ